MFSQSSEDSKKKALCFDHLDNVPADGYVIGDKDEGPQVFFAFGCSKLASSRTSFWSLYVSAVLNGACAFSEAY